MIQSFFASGGKYSQVMGRMFDLIVLNVLLIVCSLPVFTIGAALTAFYDMSLRMHRDEENSIVKGFFRAFKRDFKQATKIWLIFLAVIAVSAGDIAAGRILAGYGLLIPLRIIGGIQMFLVLLLLPYACSLTARFENTTGGTLKNSIFLAIAHIPTSIMMLLLGSSGIWILLWVPMPDKILYCFVSMVLMFWFAVCLHQNGKQIHKIFQLHFQSEEPEEKETN